MEPSPADPGDSFAGHPELPHSAPWPDAPDDREPVRRSAWHIFPTDRKLTVILLLAVVVVAPVGVAMPAIGVALERFAAPHAARDDSSMAGYSIPPAPEPAAATSGDVAPLPFYLSLRRAVPRSSADSGRAGSCDGDETVCATVATSDPVDTLAKLGAAIPLGTATRYRIRLSVMPLDDPQ